MNNNISPLSFLENKSFEYVILDTSTLVDFSRGAVGCTDIQYLDSDNFKLAITLTSLLEFLNIFKGEFEYKKNKNYKNNCEFLRKKDFYIIPTLRCLVARELEGCVIKPKPVSDLIKALEAHSKEKLTKLLESYKQQENLCKGKAGEINKPSPDLIDAVDKFYEEHNDYLAKHPSNIPLPSKDDSIKDDILNDELFKWQMPLDKAIERAEELISIYKELFEICIVSDKEIIIISPEGKKSLLRDGSELQQAFPYLFRLLLWHYIHNKQTQSKKGNNQIIANQLEPNSSKDIEIFLNSVSSKNLFITADKGDKSYCELLFKPYAIKQSTFTATHEDKKKKYYLLWLPSEV